MPDRRIVKVAISFDLLIEWLTQDNEIKGLLKTTKGLPKDAEYIGSFFEQRTMEAWLVFRHESFGLVNEAAEIPYFEIRFTKYEESAAVNA